MMARGAAVPVAAPSARPSTCRTTRRSTTSQQIYEEGWQLGLKAVALYRDGCKASAAALDRRARRRRPKKDEAAACPTRAAPPMREPAPRAAHAAHRRPARARTASACACRKKRHGFTQEARVGGHKIFLRTGEYEDGTLGEIFIDMHKEGAAFRSLMNCFAMSGLDRPAVRRAARRRTSSSSRSRASSRTASVEGHPNIKFATSIVDYIFRVLGVEYLQRYDLAHVKPDDGQPGRAIESTPSLTRACREACRRRSRQRLAPLPHTREATARSAAMSEALGDGTTRTAPLDAQLDEMMGDAPVCDVCGHITVRNGACYKCLNCGNSMGCS